MKKIFGALVIAAALSACGLLKTTVNYADGKSDQTNDPVGLKGKAVTVSLLGKGTATIQAQRTQNFPDTGQIASFPDITGIPAGVSLSEWGFTVSLTTPSGGATLTGSACPATLTITANTASLNVKDASAGGNGTPVNLTFNPASMVLSRKTSSPSCTYDVPATPIQITATITGQALTSVVNTITTGGANQVSGSITYTYDDTVAGQPSPGASLSLVFGGGTGYVIAGL